MPHGSIEGICVVHPQHLPHLDPNGAEPRTDQMNQKKKNS